MRSNFLPGKTGKTRDTQSAEKPANMCSNYKGYWWRRFDPGEGFEGVLRDRCQKVINWLGKGLDKDQC